MVSEKPTEKSLELRLTEGQEIKETLPPKEVSFAFIKPKFLRLLPEIEKVLNDNGLEIIYADKLRLSGEAVDYIYGDKIEEHYYKIIKEYLTSNDSIVLLVAGHGGETQKILLNLKKQEDGKPGILRQKFQNRPFVSEEEKRKWERGENENQDETTILLTQSNVIHTADTLEEALESLKIILGPKFEEMKQKGNLPAELWDLFQRPKESEKEISD